MIGFNLSIRLVLVYLFFIIPQDISSISNDDENVKFDWPVTLCERNLHYVTDNYAIYGKNYHDSTKIKEFIDSELNSFLSILLDKGIVFTIDSDIEASVSIGKWYNDNVKRNSILSSFNTVLKISYLGGRQYCIDTSPYFRESFFIPYKKASQIDIFEGVFRNVPNIHWICFITTDDYFKESADNKIIEYQDINNRNWKRLPITQKLMYLPAKLLSGIAYNKYKCIDKKLMHLQRKETLWCSITYGLINNHSTLSNKIFKLRNSVTNQWKEILSEKPKCL